MIFWLTYLPMSLVGMQMNWGGFFFDEPRRRIPFSFAVVGILLQAGMLLIDRSSLVLSGKLLSGVAL